MDVSQVAAGLVANNTIKVQKKQANRAGGRVGLIRFVVAVTTLV